MAFKTKRLLKKIVSWSGLFFFAVAAYMIYHQLSKYKLEDIKDALVSIPAHNLFLACMASLGGYVALSSYDFLALKYIGRKLAPWKWIFSGFTYLVACFFLIILGYFLTPDHAFGEGSVSHLTTLTVTVISALGLLVYFGASLFYKKPIIIKDVEFDIPSFKMALAQVFIGGADILLASLVLYYSLTPFMDIPFDVFIGVFIIAQVLGVFSQVPGGLGVFEGLFLYIIPGDHNQALIFGALIAYRIIYYLFPLIISGIVLFTYEWYTNYSRNRRLSK